MTECKNYKGIRFLSVVRKISTWIFVDIVRRVIGGFRAGKGIE